MLKLDSIEMSSRLKTYNSRSVKRVEPRSRVNHLTKRVGMDVWEPALKDVVFNNTTESPKNTKHTTDISVNNIGTSKITDVQNRSSFTPRTISPNKYINKESNNISDLEADSMFRKLDFSASASDWKKQKKSNFNFGKSNITKAGFKNFALYGMAVTVFLFGVAAAMNSFMTDKKIVEAAAKPQESSDQEEFGGATDDASDESKTDVGAYKVAPDMPRVIYIPKLKVNARVTKMGIKNDGSLEAPKNVHDVGWYKNSSKPGSPGGASLIDGHVSGPTQKGVFYKIETLKSGDVITIERGDGSKLEYSVVKTEVAKATETDMAKMMLPVTVGKHGLNLITCTGKFDSSTKTYEDRALVYAEFVKAY